MAIRNLVSFQRPSVNSFRYNEEYSHGCRNEIRRRIHLANAHPPARFGQLLCNPVNYRDGYDEESRSIRKLCKLGSKGSRKIELYDEV